MRSKKVFLCLISMVILLLGVSVNAEEITKMMVTSLDAKLSSIKIPIEGKWVETGPITISLGEKKATELNLEERKGLIIWPARIEAPLFKELGIKYLEADFVGLVEFKKEMMISADFSKVLINLPYRKLEVIIKNDNGNDRIFRYPEPYMGRFIPDLVSSMDFKYEALKRAMDYLYMDLKNPEEFLKIATELEEETGHEIVIYYPEYDEYMTADLEGEFCIEFDIK